MECTRGNILKKEIGCRSENYVLKYVEELVGNCQQCRKGLYIEQRLQVHFSGNTAFRRFWSCRGGGGKGEEGGGCAKLRCCKEGL